MRVVVIDPAAVLKLALGFLFLYYGLIWVLPFTERGLDAWWIGHTSGGSARGRGLPTPLVQGELRLLPDGDDRIRDGANRSDYYHDFNMVNVLDRITSHPQRFLKARYVTTARILSEEVTAPDFTDIARSPPSNRTADLMGWLRADTYSICRTMMQGTKQTIFTLAQQERSCGVTDPASQQPAENDAAEHAGPQDIRCSAEAANKRDRLLRSARSFEEEMKPACNQIWSVLRESKTASRSNAFQRGLLKEVKAAMTDMEAELKLLRDIVLILFTADIATHSQPERLMQHLRRRGEIGGVQLEVLASRAATGYPGDLDSFTAVFLHILRGTNLIDSPNELPKFGIWADPLLSSMTPSQWRNRWIRVELESQTRIVNTTSDMLASAILPGAREWLILLREVNNTEVFETTSNGYDATDDEASLFDWDWDWNRHSWADPNKADRMVKAVEDGADHLKFLRGYLLQLRDGLPGMLNRLDRWDDEVVQLADDLTTVLSWGKRYTGLSTRTRIIGFKKKAMREQKFAVC
ncbi:hypothetical protein INS49_013220 [Diaporthe citri]|uniref:uncharacterized protein n=1 Tax=Diaporthe citri TaxID=83186 RepID=UPI001C802660|nr:uncharacterized protein INS49_013220 [Diaporthe citri]KAG6357344.1 hypothetical protein INS49_013220 [Diaporthe citri]